MGTKNCSNCGAEINSEAEICPKCGVRQAGKKNLIKKLPLINSEKKNTRIVGYIIYAFIALWLVGAIFGGHESTTPMATHSVIYTIGNHQVQIDEPEGITRDDNNPSATTYVLSIDPHGGSAYVESREKVMADISKSNAAYFSTTRDERYVTNDGHEFVFVETDTHMTTGNIYTDFGLVDEGDLSINLGTHDMDASTFVALGKSVKLLQ